MKRIVWLIVFVALMTSIQAQDTILVNRAVKTELSVDQRINAKIQPITNFIESIVFWTIDFKKEVEFSHIISEQESRIVSEPPFTLQYDSKGEVPIGRSYKIENLEGDDFALSYDYIDQNKDAFLIRQVFTSNQPADFNGFLFTLIKNDSNPTENYKFRITSIGMPFVLIWLILGAIIFTLYFKFVNVRKFKLAIDIVRGKFSNPKEAGEVSHFQALTAALSATVGLGNIAGVAIAISLGGPGATFWMILAGLIGMSSKFVECTLGVKYRHIDENGVVHGGPMYYLKQGLKLKGLGKLGKVLAGFFAIMCIGGSFGGGNMFQVNQAFKQFSGTFNAGGILEHGWVFGLIMSILVALVIIGGIKSIARVTEKIVPFMVVIYVLAALVIIFGNYSEIPHTIGLIFRGAFSPEAVTGGFVGVLIQGFRRAAFSNEAGIGSASIAHSAVKTDNPVSEGLVALLEPFIDTVVVCTMTALVIIITGNYLNADASDGISITSKAFEGVISWFPWILALAVILFAFSTMISWSYYGLQSWKYLFGKTRTADLTYKALFCIVVIIGAAMNLDPVVGFSDAMIFAMSFPNILGLVILMPVVRNELSKYLNKIKSGEIVKK
jgi:alanine or glycine:cation symporter, AGCS family